MKRFPIWARLKRADVTSKKSGGSNLTKASLDNTVFQDTDLTNAKLNLALWQVEADSISISELYAWLVDGGLPYEVAIRLHQLSGITEKVGNKIFTIGKIVLIKIIDFVKAHPFLIIGAGLGTVLGFAVATLISSVPFFRQLLTPVALALGLRITAVGAGVGYKMDKCLKGFYEHIFERTKEFFRRITDVFNEIFRNRVTA